MKRFYEKAEVTSAEGGFGIALDGRPVRTPGRALLAVPSNMLAEAIAAEWNGQGETIDPRSMPLTGLANAAIDRIAPDAEAFARSLAIYGESDLTCYRAEGPQALVQRQADAWDPLIAWARRRFDVDFEIVCGVMHRPQQEMTLRQLGQAVASRTAFELAGISPLVTVSGSLLVGLALAEGAVDLETAWAAATVDEAWQTEQWGADAEAEKALEGRRRDFEAGSRFLKLL